jgi:penicillin amidase
LPGWRLLRGLVSLVTALLMLAGVGLAAALDLSLPPLHQSLAIAGLTAPVSISFDQDGVPRIAAKSLADATTALGYVHARDRMFQLDLTRHLVSGRLAELVGPPGLPSDRFMRRLGARRAAEADLASLDAGTRALLDAYARGVNAWIRQRGRFASLEHLALGPPEPWQPVDCLLWAKLMGIYLSDNMRTELARLSLAGKLPPERIAELWPDQGGGHPEAALDIRYADAAAATLRAIPQFPQPFTLPATASNAWVVDGGHSTSGAPLLAGDPHLAYAMPAIWYLARIDLPDNTLAGATAPGAPFLIIGHNAQIAWTFTTTGADVQDVFEETRLDATHYLGPSGPLEFGQRQEVIHVRRGGDVVLTVRETRHGPIISEEDAEHLLAAAMTNLAAGDTAAAGLLALNQASDIDQAGAAAPRISSPVQNLLVADRQRIALFVTGRVPIRKAGDGSAPVPGAEGAFDWTGYASGNDLPHVVAPASGHLVNANERVAPENFPVFLGRDAYGDWRARRIRTLLARKQRFSAADFAAMQMDEKSAFAEQLFVMLQAVRPPDPLATKALDRLLDWDGTMAADRPEPLIFNAWIERFYDEVLALHKVPRNAAAPIEEFTAFLLAPSSANSALWWCGGDCKPLLSRTLGEAMTLLATRFGDDPARWRWGEAHRSRFANQALAQIPLLGALATHEVPSGGDGGTVRRGATYPGSFVAVHGPAYRGVYDLADLDRSLFVIAPGQSGHLLSPHAWDFVIRWNDGQTVTLGPQPHMIEATIDLQPAQ